MAEKPSSTIPIIVAVIGVLGTVTAAAIANWDKLSGGKDRDPPASVAEHSGVATTPTVEANDILDAAAPINIAGKWIDSAGNEYMFEPGDGYSFKRYKNGEQVGWGAGNLTGYSYTYVDRGADFGDCRGTVSANLQEMNSICTVGTNQFPLKLTRKTTVTL